MLVHSIHQLDSVDQVPAQLDAVIVASGYESRARHIAQLVNGRTCLSRYAVGFNDKITHVTEENDMFFTSMGYEVTRNSSGPVSGVIRALSTVMSESSGSACNILVDYSSMSRSLLASVIAYCRDNTFPCGELNIIFGYSPYSFMQPNDPVPNEAIGPIDGFCSLSPPSLDTALVIGLGHTARRALGLMEVLDPAATFAFYTDPPLDPAFLDTILTNNASLMERLGAEHLLAYPAADLATTYSMLASFTDGLLARNYRVVLAPIGPKPFALLCLLLASVNKSLDVWRISAGSWEPPVDRPSCGVSLFCSVCYTSP